MTRAESDLVICPKFTQEQVENVGKRHATTWHEPLWNLKWGPENRFYNWSEDFKHNVIPTLKQKIPNYILYPYFEKDIEGIFEEQMELRVPEIRDQEGRGLAFLRPLYCDIVYHGADNRW